MSPKKRKHKELLRSKIKRLKNLSEIDRTDINQRPAKGSVLAGHAELAHNNTYDPLPLFHPSFHYPLRYENMNAYKIAAHQHTVEVERELSLLAGREIRVTLTTQVVPLSRGIMSTLYGNLTKSSTTAQELYDAYAEFYRGAKFVRVEPTGTPVSNNDVRGSNSCVISTNLDARTGRMIVVSHVDNLMKGQAGSALQNMNIMFGLDEDMGLRRPAYYP